MSRLSPSHPFFGAGPGSIILFSSISLPITFGMPENYCTESILFDIVEVNLPFNAIIGRPTLYQFMVVAHYGYLVLKMSLPNGIIKIRGDRSVSVFTLEKLQTLAATMRLMWGQGVPGKHHRARAACLVLCTPHAALGWRGCSHEGHADRRGCCPDYQHRGEPGRQIGTHTRHIPLG
jgi:hypothetical protein